MTTPRQLLAALAIAHIVIAVQTLRYPPDFLALTPLWCALAIAAGISCAAASIRPRRFYVATSGACLVTASAARGFALVIEWANAPTGAARGLLVGALTWWMVSLLGYVVWREYVLPWSLGRPDPE